MAENNTSSASTSNNILPFSFKGAEVRTVVMDGAPAFVGKDVCERLGYMNPNKAMNDHCKGVTKRYPLQTPGGVQEVRVLFEPDVLRLIIKSKLPEAEEFERWVFEEVIPSIRKTGSYSVSQTPKPKRIRKPSFAVTFDRCLRVASHLPNVDENQKVLMAARGTYNLTGVNPLEVMGYTALPAQTQDNYMTPTELGKQVGLSGRRVNQILSEEAHLQIYEPGSSTGSDWAMTERGLAYGKMFDTTRRGGKGSQQQLKWKPSVVEFLRPFAAPPA